MAEQSKGDLGRSSATSTKQPDAVHAAAPATKREPTEIYHVVGPGSLMRTVTNTVDGKARKSTVQIPPGELLELTAAEAAELGSRVALGEQPPPPPPIGERKGGQYRVKGPGSVMFTVTEDRGVTERGERKTISQTKLHATGALLTLTASEARELGAVVEAV